MKWFKNYKPQEEDSDFVNVLDTQTHVVTRVPARELTSNMIEAKVDGIEGTVWVDVRKLKQGEYKHPPFSEDVREVLQEIKTSLDEFHCLSLEEWEDGFRRDTNPEPQIAYWLHLARTYRILTTSRDLNREQRQDYFKVLIACLNSPREHVLNVFSPTAISVAEANNVIAQFYKPEK